MEVSKHDWKIYQEKVPFWQEAYMARLCDEYIKMLKSKRKPAAEKFWALEERIKKDKKNPGVIVEMRKSEMEMDLFRMLKLNVITEADLVCFSETLQVRIKEMVEHFG